MDAAFCMLKGIAGANGFIPPEMTAESAVAIKVANKIAFESSGFKWIVALLLFCWLAPNSNQVMRDYQPSLDTDLDEPGRLVAWIRWKPGLAWSLIVALMAVYATLHISGATEFLYFQF